MVGHSVFINRSAEWRDAFIAKATMKSIPTNVAGIFFFISKIRPCPDWSEWLIEWVRLTCCDLLLMQDINCTPVVNFEIHSLWTIYFHYCFLHLHMAILLNTLHLISVLLALSLGIQKVISIWLLILVWTVNLFSPWYSWKVTELAFNNNHSLTQSLTSIWTRSYLTYKGFPTTKHKTTTTPSRMGYTR
jgi:hypothetical protein